MTLTVAIVGRPNVGKSTLFNRLVGKRLALVAPEPGVTRDWRAGEAQLYDLTLTVIDTAGLEEADDTALETRMRKQTERALATADAVFFLIDARAGVTPLDRHFASWLRRTQVPVILVANKCEGAMGEAGRMEAYDLGFGEAVPVSAEHGLGMSDLHEALVALDVARSADDEADGLDEEEAEDDGVLQLAVLGRPNAGKSTLVNRLVGEERVLTGPEAGITRDAIAVDWEFEGRAIRLIDTAGLRRRARVVEDLEKLSVADALRSLRFAHVAVLLLDAASPLDKQDLVIASRVVEEGRALVIALNKWDACADRQATMAQVRDRLERSLPQTGGVPVVTVSALRGQNLDKLMRAVVHAYDVWNRRVPTAALNRWLAAMVAAHPPPAPGGRRIKMRYMTQAKGRPPTFIVFCSRPDGIPDSYLRYLENGLRAAFDMPGTPIRIHLRKGDNPYAPRKGRRQ